MTTYETPKEALDTFFFSPENNKLFTHFIKANERDINSVNVDNIQHVHYPSSKNINPNAVNIYIDYSLPLADAARIDNRISDLTLRFLREHVNGVVHQNVNKDMQYPTFLDGCSPFNTFQRSIEAQFATNELSLIVEVGIFEGVQSRNVILEDVEGDILSCTMVVTLDIEYLGYTNTYQGRK